MPKKWFSVLVAMMLTLSNTAFLANAEEIEPQTPQYGGYISVEGAKVDALDIPEDQLPSYNSGAAENASIEAMYKFMYEQISDGNLSFNIANFACPATEFPYYFQMFIYQYPDSLVDRKQGYRYSSPTIDGVECMKTVQLYSVLSTSEIPSAQSAMKAKVNEF